MHLPYFVLSVGTSLTPELAATGGAVPIFLRLENNYELTLNSTDAETAVRRARRQCGLD